MIPEYLISETPFWLNEEGLFSEIVLSSRVRIARNLEDTLFVQRASTEILQETMEKIKESILNMKNIRSFMYMGSLNPVERQFLMERRIVSHDIVEKAKYAGVGISNDEKAGVMVNEEDHIRIYGIMPGLNFTEAYESADDIDNFVSKELDIAYDKEFGYLTACPTNVGTGMRASVLIHLPALVLTKEIDKALRSFSQMGYLIRGLYGEGTQVQGNMFQITNQRTLGISEEEIIQNLSKMVRELINYEINAREILVKNAKYEVEDKIWRAYAILSNARLLTSEEVINLASAVRFGIGLGIITNIPIKTLNKLLVLTQPAHIQIIFEKKMEAEERDITRAEFVRKILSGGENG